MIGEMIRTNQGYITTKTMLTEGERDLVREMNKEKICNSCLELWLLKRDFIVTENSRTKNLNYKKTTITINHQKDIDGFNETMEMVL